MSVKVDVAGTENETPAELKRVRTQLVLSMASRLRAGPGLGERPVQVVFTVDVPRLNSLVVRLLTAAQPISLPRTSTSKH